MHLLKPLIPAIAIALFTSGAGALETAKSARSVPLPEHQNSEQRCDAHGLPMGEHDHDHYPPPRGPWLVGPGYMPLYGPGWSPFVTYPPYPPNYPGPPVPLPPTEPGWDRYPPAPYYPGPIPYQYPAVDLTRPPPYGDRWNW